MFQSIEARNIADDSPSVTPASPYAARDQWPSRISSAAVALLQICCQVFLVDLIQQRLPHLFLIAVRCFAEYVQQKAVVDGVAESLVLPAYEYCLKCSHTFNLLDARGAISVTERTGYIARVRNLARGCGEAYLEQRQNMGFPLLNRT